MTSVVRSPKQIPWKAGYFLATDFTFLVMPDSTDYVQSLDENGEFNFTIIDGYIPGLTFRDMGKEIVVVGPPNDSEEPQLVHYRLQKVQLVNGPDGEGVSNNSPVGYVFTWYYQGEPPSFFNPVTVARI